MLGQLVNYATRKQLVAEPGFAPKDIKWLASVSLDGRFTGVIPLGDGKSGKSFPCCPDLGQPEMVGMPKALRAAGYSVEQAAHFLADTCGVVALVQPLDKNGNPKTDSKSLEDHGKNTQKHPTFKLLIDRASAQIKELEPIQAALESEEEVTRLRQELEQRKAKPTDKITFFIEDVAPLETSVWHDWWRNFRTETFGKGGDLGKATSSTNGMLCLTSGQIITPANTHPKVTKLGVGANPTGASLIGYDKDAFASFGLEQGQNGAVSEDAASAYRASLDHLLEKAPILGQMKVALWYDQEIDPEDDLFSDLFEPNPENTELSALERAKKLLTAIRSGDKPESLARSRFYAMAMSGAAGRVMVRDWHTGSLEQFVIAVETWFEDLSIINARGTQNANLPGLNRLMMSVQRPKSPETKLDDYLKPVQMLQVPFWRAALEPNAPIPFAAIGKVMESHRAEVMTGKFDETIKSRNPDESRASLGRIYARMGLLKAYHNRKGDRMKPGFDPNETYPPAYHCGRLMYLLANIQEAALGSDLNAGVVQRYYGAASSTPALVLGRLTRLSQSHLGKISGDRPGLAVYLERQIAQVWNVLGKDLPKTLSLEEQSLFALGYYQQLASRPEGNNKSDDSSNT